MTISPDSVAGVVAKLLKARGVKHVFALCGGHIMPIWMRLDAEGIRIIDVRDERCAVHMAQAHAELTGELGVALVTAGPGFTNAITGIANAHVSRAPVLVISGTVTRPQENRGALQDLDQPQLVRSITRYARTVRESSRAVAELDDAISCALGEGGEPGPSYIDFPTDTLRAEVPKALQLEEHLAAKPRRMTLPDQDAVAEAADLLWSARRVLVISGRGARGAGRELTALLDRLGAVYLDTGESRGLVPEDHPSVVSAMRGAVMGDADVILTVGRRLDFQLAAAKLKTSMAAAPAGKDGRLHPNKVLAALQNAMPQDSIVVTDGGDFLAFARIGLSAPQMLDPGPFGCIGVGVPYGVAASLAYPEKIVLVATGDGAFGFNAMEIDTAVRHKAPVLIAVANNGAWAIEVHDQTVTHGKVVGTRLRDSDYAGIARALGMHAERVEKEEDIGPAIERALANRPALIDFVVTPEAVSSDGKTGLAWVPDLQPLAAWDDAERKWRAGGS